MVEGFRHGRQRVKHWFLLLLFVSWAWAESNFERQGLSLTLPTTWNAQTLGEDDPTLLAVLHSPQEALIFVRRHPSRPGQKLEDVFNQLKYSIVVKLEGRVLDKSYTTIDGKQAMRVKYWGRASTGPMKQFVRYFFFADGFLINVHCVCASKDAREEAEFKSIAESVSYHPPSEPAPAPPL